MRHLREEAPGIRGFPLGEVLAFALAATVALALTTQAGRRLSRRLLLLGGWAASAVLITTGGLAAFGALAQASGWISDVGTYQDAWIVDVVYGSWLLLGLGLAVCTHSYRTRLGRPDLPPPGGPA